MYDKLNLKLEDAQVDNTHKSYDTSDMCVSSSSEEICSHAETH